MTSGGIRVPPKVLLLPEGRVGSWGDDIAEVAERLGTPPTPEQYLAMDTLGAYDRRGLPLSTHKGLELSRQSGKTTTVALAKMLHGVLTDPDLYTWSAHRSRTHKATFNSLADPESGLIANNDWLRRRVRTIVRDTNAEAIRFVNNAELEFVCRSGRVRGRASKEALFDEALYLDAATAGAMTPALSTRSLHGGAQALFVSSAALAASKLWRGMRRRALAGDKGLTYIGWWASGSWADPGCQIEGCRHTAGTPGCALDDETLWAESVILLDQMTSRDFLRGERLSMDPIEFGREYLGWQEDGDDAVSLDAWAGLEDASSVAEPGSIRVAFDVGPQGRRSAVVAAGRRADGVDHLEVLHAETGVAGLPGALRELREWGVTARYDGRPTSPVAGVLRDLQGVEVEPMTVGEFAQACGHFERRVRSGMVRHLGDPILAEALEVAARQDIGDGAWLLSRKSSEGDISPAVAAVMALWELGSEDTGQILF